MQELNVPIFRSIGTLTSKTTPSLGWDVLFDSDLSAVSIQSFIPQVENCLNEYLKSHVNILANNLVVPFTCRLTAVTGNPQLYNFKVQVFKKFLFFKITFNYPPGPILSINHFQLVKGPMVESQASSIALKPPSPVK